MVGCFVDNTFEGIYSCRREMLSRYLPLGTQENHEGSWCSGPDSCRIPRKYMSRHEVAQLVEVLCCTPQDHGSIPDEVIVFFNLPNPSSRTMALGSTQPLTEMITRNLPRGKGLPARKAENLTAICEQFV
jgi:hypothetical protein